MNEYEIGEILLVEDSEADAEMIIRALKKHQLTNKLTWVRDGAAALDYVYRTGTYEKRNGGNPKLILLDIKMPKMDGIEVLKRLRSFEPTKTIPVVMLTSSAEGRDIEESYKLGVNSYLVKPVDFMQFIDVVSQAGFYWAAINKVPV